MATGEFENPDQFSHDEAERGFGERLTRKEQLIEVFVFLLLIVPTMILSYFVTQEAGGDFTILAIATIVRDLALLALILFFIWRNGERPEIIGWTAKHEWADLVLGVLLFIPLTFLIIAVQSVLQRLGFTGPAQDGQQFFLPQGPIDIMLAITLVIVVAITEEFIFRGYLIRRFSSVTRSLFWAIILSSIIFAFGHGYQGGIGVITIGIVGLVFALVYVWRRSLMAPVVMHFLQNFTAIVVVPYLAQQ